MDALRTDSDTEQFIIAALRSVISVSSLSLKMSKLYSPESLLSIAAFQQNSPICAKGFQQINHHRPLNEIKCVQAIQKGDGHTLCISKPFWAAWAHSGRSNQPHSAVSIGIICFLRLITPGRKSIFSFGSAEKARRMVSSLPTYKSCVPSSRTSVSMRMTIS